jgi:hypothetical protein
LVKWAAFRPPLSESRAVVEETFLWGCQTAQRLAGILPDSSTFIVSAEMLFNQRWTRVLGWQLSKKDGGNEMLLFGDAKDWLRRSHGILMPVVRKKKRRKRSA